MPRKKQVQAQPQEQVQTQPQEQPQIIDVTLKSLFGDEAADIIPALLPETRLVDEVNIEIDRTTLKADLVYNTIHKGEPAMLNLELQTNASSAFIRRMLQYHAALHAKHKVPVISMVIYPFETDNKPPPYEEKIGNELFLSFPFKELCLWKEHAEAYVRQHKVYMYTLLPAMQGANVLLLQQALAELADYYADRTQLERHLPRFMTIMEKSTTMTEDDKNIIREELRMQYHYDEFIDHNPDVIARMLESEARGEAKGEAKGELQGIQKMARLIVQDRFPALVALTQEKAALLNESDALSRLVLQLTKAPDEATARWLLNTIEE